MSTELNRDRGWIGRFRRFPTLELESYEDFCEGVRVFMHGPVNKASRAAMDGTVAAAAKAGRELSCITAIRAAFDSLPPVAAYFRIKRSSQEMVRRRIFEHLHAHRDIYLKELADADTQGPGNVEYDTTWKPPEYSFAPFHIQSGGYGADPFAGYAYHWGTVPFFSGRDTQDEVHIGIAKAARAPADGVVARILDLGCSAGQLTVALKERFPDAAVTGLDIHAAQVRYAHKRARDLGATVDFIQRAAEDTKLPDGHFDMVTAFILFHEVPPDAADQIVAEAFRVLRPGGTFSIFDFPTDLATLPPQRLHYLELDGKDNCEPYALDFVTRDFTGLLERTGFRVSKGQENNVMTVRGIFCEKPV